MADIKTPPQPNTISEEEKEEKKEPSQNINLFDVNRLIREISETQENLAPQPQTNIPIPQEPPPTPPSQPSLPGIGRTGSRVASQTGKAAAQAGRLAAQAGTRLGLLLFSTPVGWVILAVVVVVIITFAIVFSLRPSNTTASTTTEISPQPTIAAAEVISRPTGDFKPEQASIEVDNVIRDIVAKYNLPRWFLYAIIQRESSFNPEDFNPNGGYGLTQLTGEWYVGMPYPENLSAPDDDHQQYADDMNFKQYGKWILMSQVTQLSQPFDPKQNLDRFATGYAVPAFNRWKTFYNLSDGETLRMIAFSWNKGVYLPYDSNNQDYLQLYDQYVAEFKGPVEVQDGVWNGQPILPPAP